MSLAAEFSKLELALEQLIDLLEAEDEKHWARYLARGLPDITSGRLAGATYVLGCYGGEDTLSDLIVARDRAAADPQGFADVNARLTEVRTRVFESASAIASRRLW